MANTNVTMRIDTKYNSDGKAVVSKDDEWRDESEWDDIYEQMKKERGI